jgi:hypothetical protein
LISVPPGTEMFQFPGLAPHACAWVTDLAIGRVSPFGHPGITARLQLPQAYRSLPRPSSPLDAKASTVCLIAFDLKFDLRRAACAMRHSFRQTTRCDPPDGVDSSHPDLPVAREIKSSIHRLSKSWSDPNPPVTAGSGSDKRSERELEAGECGRLPRLFRPPGPKAGAYSRSPERR